MSEGVYLRVIHEVRAQDPEHDPSALEALVTRCAQVLPGVALGKPIERHPRGGYKLSLICRPEQREGIVLFLRAEGWLAVI